MKILNSIILHNFLFSTSFFLENFTLILIFVLIFWTDGGK